MIRKRFHQNWIYECPNPVLTCSILKCVDQSFMVFGGHDKKLYLMDNERNILDDISFDGWCRCSYPIDLDGDGCDEILVGAGDGSFLVVKLDKNKKKLVGIMHYKSIGKVNCCVAGDLYRNGNSELIFGGEDKTIKIFEDPNSKEPLITLYFDSWVTACSVGSLKLPQFTKPICGLLIGTKNGLLRLVQIIDNKPDILWQRHVYAQINSIKVGDVTNDGYNDIIVSTDDSYIKIFNSEGKRLKYMKTEKSRPVSLLIEDIDGDKAKEIVAGCANGSLIVYHNPKLNSKNIELKWKTKISNSIKDICFKPDFRNIIFGGYNRELRNITDFELDEKPILDIPKSIEVSEIQPTKKLKVKIVPTTLIEHITKILEEKGFYLTLEILTKELIEFGYSRDQIEEELNIMKSQGIINYGKINIPVWSLTGRKVKVKIPVAKPVVSSMAQEIATVEQPSAGKALKDVIIEYLKEKKLVSTKPNLVNGIVGKGFTKAKVDKEINALKNQGMIQYSRSAPKGWSFASAVPLAGPAKPVAKAAVSVDNKELEDKILNFLREKKIVGTKAEFVNSIVSMGFSKGVVDKQINALKDNNKIKYSRSAPRGWSINE